MCLEATKQRLRHNMLLTSNFWRKNSTFVLIECRQIQVRPPSDFKTHNWKSWSDIFYRKCCRLFGWKVQFLRTILWLFCQVSPSQRHQGQHVGIPYQNQSKNDFGDFRENKARQTLLYMHEDPIRLHSFKTSYLRSFLPKRGKHPHTFNRLAQRL